MDFSNGVAREESGMDVDDAAAQFNNPFAQPGTGLFNDSQHMDAMQDSSLASSMQQGQYSSEEKMKRTYHQNKALLDQPNNTMLWQVPSPSRQLIQVHQQHAIGRNFHKACDLIKKHWQVEPVDAVPEEMRSATPYSQALLNALRRMASNTKGDYNTAQEALLSVWRDRLNSPSGMSKDQSGTGFFQTQVEALAVNVHGCETHIIENVHGLTVEDVFAARHLAKKGIGKREKVQVPLPAGKLRGSASKAEQAAARRLRKENRDIKRTSRDAAVEMRQAETTPLLGKSKIKKQRERKEATKVRDKISRDNGYKLLQFLQDEDEGGITLEPGKELTPGPSGDVAPPNSPEPDTEPIVPERQMRDATKKKARAARATAADTNADGEIQLLSARDHHDYDLLSSMFNRVDVDGPTLKARKARALLDSSAKRSGTVPDARAKLAEMPTLYAQQEPRREEEALEGMGKMKLEMKQENGMDPHGMCSAQGVEGAQGFSRAHGVGEHQGIFGAQSMVGNQDVIGAGDIAGMQEWGDGQDGGVKLEDDEEL